jgi:hypothetical protein
MIAFAIPQPHLGGWAFILIKSLILKLTLKILQLKLYKLPMDQDH